MKNETTILAIFMIGLSVACYGIRSEQLLRKEGASRLQRLLGCVFAWWALSTCKDLALYIPDIDTKDVLRHVFFMDGCGAVTFALMLMELTIPGWVTGRRVCMMILPFVGFLLLHIIITDDWFQTVFTVFFVGFALIAVGIAIYKSRGYARAIRNAYSNLEDVDISWVWTIVIAFAICQLVWWAASDDYGGVADTIYYASSLACWYVTMHHVNKMRPLRLTDNQEKHKTDFAGTELSASKCNYLTQIGTQLEKLMDEERPYLNPELTLSDLAILLNTNRTYLSRYLSTELGTTFYDYTNRLRIERQVIPMMQEKPNLTLEYMAEAAGFKSITTFRRAFRKLTGMLPSEYMTKKTEHA